MTTEWKHKILDALPVAADGTADAADRASFDFSKIDFSQDKIMPADADHFLVVLAENRGITIERAGFTWPTDSIESMAGDGGGSDEAKWCYQLDDPNPHTYHPSWAVVPADDIIRHLDTYNGGGGSGVNRPTDTRRLKVTRASQIPVRPVHWIYDERLPGGCLSLIAGQGGLGKSTVCYSWAAQLTRGALPGRWQGVPRSVIVAATEDSWEHTIVPRLMAADADLNRVLRVEVEDEDKVIALSLPQDVPAVHDLILAEEVVLVLLDPLTSRLEDSLDSHKDAEVRTALEPLAQLAQDTGVSVLGVMHHNKSGSTDPLKALIASVAFANVARAVHTVLPRPGHQGERVVGIAKNNLGRLDLPSMVFRIDGWTFNTAEGPGVTGKVTWLGDTPESVAALMAASDTSTAGGAAAVWLKEYMVGLGGSAPREKVIADGKAAGHTETALKRAQHSLGIKTKRSGFGGGSTWQDPAAGGLASEHADPSDASGSTDDGSA